jgi:uncharacterized protein YkwD
MSPTRLLVTASVIAVALALPAAAPAPITSSAEARVRHDRVERAVVRKVNAIRRTHRLRPLRTSRGLARAADRHSLDLLRADVVSHTSPDGTPMPRRVRRYVRARAVGETIAWVDVRTARQAQVIVQAWMASPAHRAALLSARFRRVGVGRRKGVMRGVRTTVTTLNLASKR